MKFNYQTEKKKFEAKWKETESCCRRYGMQEEKIQELKAYDWDEFRRERVFRAHNQYFPEPPDDCGEEMEQELQNPIYQRFMDACSILMPMADPEDRYGWINEIEDERIGKAVRKLSELDRELITLLVFEEYTQQEVAKRLGISQQAVSLRFDRIRKNFEKVFA